MLANTGARVPLVAVALLCLLRPLSYVRAQVASASPSSSAKNPAEMREPERRSKPSSSEAKVDSKLLQQFLGNCCKNAFLPPERNPPKVTPPFSPESHRLWSAEGSLITVAVPVYIPYAIGYEPDQSDVEGEAGTGTNEDGSESARGSRGLEPRELMSYDSYGDFPTDEADDNNESPPPEEPVVTQPATILVYRDGHRAEVVNYAILGDALFDFDDDGTRKIPLADLDLTATAKANDLRGVEFKTPVGAVR